MVMSKLLNETHIHRIISNTIKTVLLESIYDAPTDINGTTINIGDILEYNNTSQNMRIRGIVRNIRMDGGWYEYSKEPIFLITMDAFNKRTKQITRTITVTSKDIIEVKGNVKQLNKMARNRGNLLKKRKI